MPSSSLKLGKLFSDQPEVFLKPFSISLELSDQMLVGLGSLCFPLQTTMASPTVLSLFVFLFAYYMIYMPKRWSSNHSAQFLKGHVGVAAQTEQEACLRQKD